MSILDQTVSQHCTKKVITVSPETSVCTAIELMNKSKITSVLVCEGRLPIGILTARDLPKIFAGHEHNLDNPILNLMSKPIEKCNETNTLLDALDMMINNELRHLPIVDKHNNLAGIISETDIVNALGFFNPMKHQSVNEIMDSSLIFIKPDISLSEIMILFESRGTDCLLVTNESTTIGIVTERDIPRLILSGVSPDTLAGSVMSEPIISVSLNFRFRTRSSSCFRIIFIIL